MSILKKHQLQNWNIKPYLLVQQNFILTELNTKIQFHLMSYNLVGWRSY